MQQTVDALWICILFDDSVRTTSSI